MLPRILLLLPTTTYRTHAFVEAARHLGVDVTVGSEEPSTMSGLNPVGFITLDMTEPAHAAQQVAEFAQHHPIAAVVAVDDQVTAIGAAISARLGLPANSVESSMAARNKHTMRELLARAAVPHPRFQLCFFDQDPKQLPTHVVQFPCVIKPLSGAASQGVIRADNAAELGSAIIRLRSILQLTDRFLIEQFIPGPEVAVEGLLTRGNLRVLAIFDKPDPLDGPFFEETIYVTPSRFSAAIQQAIATVTSDACHALGLVHGPVHAELRLANESVKPVVIEVNPRSIGGLCSRVLRFGTGLSLEELIIRHAIDPEFMPPDREGQSAGVMMIPIPRGGTLREVRGLEPAKAVAGIQEVTISARIGQQLVPLPEGSVYLGFIFARGASPDSVEKSLREAHSQIEFVIDPL